MPTPPASAESAAGLVTPPGSVEATSQAPLPRATAPKPVLGIVSSGEDLAPLEEAPSAMAVPSQAPAAAQPAPVPSADGGDSDRWRFVVERVKERKLLLGTCLEEGLCVGATGASFTLALSPEHSFHKAMLEMKENRDLIQQELEKGFGRKLTFQCVVREPGADRAAETRARADRAAREALASNDPEEVAAHGAGDSLVRRIVDLFDGEIMEMPDAPKREGNA